MRRGWENFHPIAQFATIAATSGIFRWGSRSVKPPSSAEKGSFYRSQQALRERPLVINPLDLTTETSALGHRSDLLGTEFVAALRPDRFAFLQGHREALVDRDRLIRPGPQMHLDALLRGVVARFVLELLQIEIRSESSIDSGKKIEVKGGSQTDRVVVSRQH